MQQVMVANGGPSTGTGMVGQAQTRDVGFGSGSRYRPCGMGVGVIGEGGPVVKNGPPNPVQGDSQLKTARGYKPRTNFRVSTQPATARPSSLNGSSYGVGSGATRPRVKTQKHAHIHVQKHVCRDFSEVF